MSKWSECSGISDICHAYQIFLLDQWGVLHDGLESFPDALNAVQFLNANQREVVLVTNSGKSAESNLQRLDRLGYRREWFAGIMTSGDLATDLINRDYAGSGIYWIDYAFDVFSRQKLASHSIVHRVDDADLIYLSGWAPSKMEWRSYADILAVAAGRRIPMICGNPDVSGFEMGRTAIGPGWVAGKFREIGGRVIFVGKPDPAVFVTALQSVRNSTLRLSVVVGDSFSMDICGAAKAGMDSILISNGVHRELFMSKGVQAAIEALSLEYSAGQIFPKFILPVLSI